jgi:hypothetical protein
MTESRQTQLKSFGGPLLIRFKKVSGWGIEQGEHMTLMLNRKLMYLVVGLTIAGLAIAGVKCCEGALERSEKPNIERHLAVYDTNSNGVLGYELKRPTHDIYPR